MKIKIQTFAILKDFFPSDFSLEIGESGTVSDALQALYALNPSSEGILAHCKYVVSEEFVEEDEVLKEGDALFLLPPSSGG